MRSLVFALVLLTVGREASGQGFPSAEMLKKHHPEVYSAAQHAKEVAKKVDKSFFELVPSLKQSERVLRKALEDGAGISHLDKVYKSYTDMVYKLSKYALEVGDANVEVINLGQKRREDGDPREMDQWIFQMGAHYDLYRKALGDYVNLIGKARKKLKILELSKGSRKQQARAGSALAEPAFLIQRNPNLFVEDSL